MPTACHRGPPACDHRHHDCAQQSGRKHGLDKVHTGGQQQSHVITRSNSEGFQVQCFFQDAFTNFRVRAALIRADDRHAHGLGVGGQQQPISQGSRPQTDSLQAGLHRRHIVGYFRSIQFGSIHWIEKFADVTAVNAVVQVGREGMKVRCIPVRFLRIFAGKLLVN